MKVHQILVGSKGEIAIRKYLMENNIPYEREITLDDNRRYDFYLPHLNLIVEIHGKQHYEEVERFKGTTLKEVQENDRIKEVNARQLGYNYMVVDYRESKPQLALKRFKEHLANI